MCIKHKLWHCDLQYILKELGLAIWIYFSHVHNYLKLKKPKNISLLMLWQENTKEVTINLKETRMVKDGEDWHG